MKLKLTDTASREIVQMTLPEKILLLVWITTMMTESVLTDDEFDPEENLKDSGFEEGFYL